MIKDIKVPIYNTRLKLYTDPIKFEEATNQHIDPSYDGASFQDDNGIEYLYLRKTSLTPQSASIISHELFHTTYSILNFVGVQLAPQSEEAFAYLQGFLTKKVYKALKKHNHDTNAT